MLSRRIARPPGSGALLDDLDCLELQAFRIGVDSADDACGAGVGADVQ